jgi:hypothetical protein
MPHPHEQQQQEQQERQEQQQQQQQQQQQPSSYLDSYLGNLLRDEKPAPPKPPLQVRGIYVGEWCGVQADVGMWLWLYAHSWVYVWT